MATRATYTFIKENGIKVEYYIHWDGYPEGAAQYLKKALDYKNTYSTQEEAGTLAEAFLRANKEAEISNRDSHGDTEYHYEIIDKNDTFNARINVYEPNRDKFGYAHWKVVATGFLRDFVG